MKASVDRSEALRLLAVEHDSIRHIINTLTDDEMTYPDTIRYGLYSDQKLSFKDLLAHLITYEVYALQAIESWQQGKKHRVSDAMRNPVESTKIHYGGIEEREAMSLEAVLQEWEETQESLTRAIDTLSDEEWYADAPYPTTEPTDLGGMLEVILVAPPRPMYRHLPVHIPDSEAYIQALRTITHHNATQ